MKPQSKPLTRAKADAKIKKELQDSVSFIKRISSSSCKNKGRQGQQEVQKMILTLFPELEPDDVRSTSMGAPGEDLLLSPAARRLIPYNVEVKRRAKIGFCRWMDQANTHGTHKPACFFREDHGEWYACVKAKDLLALLRAHTIVEDGMKRAERYKIDHPKYTCVDGELKINGK